MQAALPSHSAAMTADDINAVFRNLVSQHHVKLRRFVLKYIGNASDAEELAQLAFVEAADAFQEFRGESQLSTWLYGIAMNLVRNYLSRAVHRVHHFVEDSVLETTCCGGSGPQQTVEMQQMLSLLDRELSGLMPEMREALLMVAVDEMTYEEAAAKLALPIGTVRSRVSRARARLRQRFEAVGLQSAWAC